MPSVFIRVTKPKQIVENIGAFGWAPIAEQLGKVCGLTKGATAKGST